MNWKFWQKFTKENTQEGGLTGPTTIPEPVARYMVVEMKEEAEWVWRLKAVLAPCPERKHEAFFRVFEGKKVLAREIRIFDYSSLDNHPSLIIMEGIFNKKTGEVRDNLLSEQELRAA